MKLYTTTMEFKMIMQQIQTKLYMATLPQKKQKWICHHKKYEQSWRFQTGNPNFDRNRC